MTTLLLIHGGLWDDMGAERFWRKPGIVAGLRHHGLEVLSPDRPHRAPDWATEVEHLAAALPDQAITVVAGSNGCSAAVRLTLSLPNASTGYCSPGPPPPATPTLTPAPGPP